MKLTLHKTTLIHNLIFTYWELTSLLWQRLSDAHPNAYSLPPVCTASLCFQASFGFRNNRQWSVRSNVPWYGPKICHQCPPSIFSSVKYKDDVQGDPLSPCTYEWLQNDCPTYLFIHQILSGNNFHCVWASTNLWVF